MRLAAAATVKSSTGAAASTEHAAPAPDDSEDEWDLNNPRHCVQILNSKFESAELATAKLSPSQFTKVCAFFVDHLAKKTPKCELSLRFRKELDSGVWSNKKSRMGWLKAWMSMRSQQYMPKK
mmetsp:Transcript_7368/g.8302  ORF Transcript_7368/g.8302 Transcript_7368/m.8302 type:complete len:123 (-) Transcript_7368:19-387(-)